jgi:hypothetical protein
MSTYFKNIDRHLELLHAVLTASTGIEMRRNGRWVRVMATVKPSPYPRSDELHYYVEAPDFTDYVALSESTELLRIVRQ